MKIMILQINSFPLIISIWLFNLLGSVLYFLVFGFYDLTILCFYLVVSIMSNWWKKFFLESLMGNYLKFFKKLMKMSFLIFISSEVLLFSSMFWMFFHSSISPNIEVGLIWPPKMMNFTINFMSFPLTGSFILLMSSFTITIAHHLILNNFLKETLSNIKSTFFLGMSFSMVQIIEYSFSKINIPMTLNDSIYANSFFFITALHGSHVVGGSFYLLHTSESLYSNSFNNLTNFEMSSWYWHFVDLVWIFVYSAIYWWNMFLF